MDFADDLDALAAANLGPEHLAMLGTSAMNEGDFATFMALEPDRRNLVLRLLNNPTDADFEELGSLEGSKELAKWLVDLPAYRRATYDDDDDGDGDLPVVTP